MHDSTFNSDNEPSSRDHGDVVSVNSRGQCGGSGERGRGEEAHVDFSRDDFPLASTDTLGTERNLGATWSLPLSGTDAADFWIASNSGASKALAGMDGITISLVPRCPSGANS